MIYIQVCLIALIAKAKNWKQIKCPSTGDWLITVYLYNGIPRGFLCATTEQWPKTFREKKEDTEQQL